MNAKTARTMVCGQVLFFLSLCSMLALPVALKKKVRPVLQGNLIGTEVHYFFEKIYKEVAK